MIRRSYFHFMACRSYLLRAIGNPNAAFKRNLARGIFAYAIDTERESVHSGVPDLDFRSHNIRAKFFSESP